MLKRVFKSCDVDDVSIRWQWSKLDPSQYPYPLTNHDNIWEEWPLSRPVPGSKRLAKWACVVSAVSALWKLRKNQWPFKHIR